MSSIDTYKKGCYAIGCTAQIYRDKLMCSRHWRMVPPSLQVAVYRALSQWKASARGSFNAYVLATYRAQLAVAETKDIDAAIIARLRNNIASIEAPPTLPAKAGK